MSDRAAGQRLWLCLGFGFGEDLGGLSQGVGDGLVPVHVRAAGAEFPRALTGQGCHLQAERPGRIRPR